MPAKVTQTEDFFQFPNNNKKLASKHLLMTSAYEDMKRFSLLRRSGWSLVVGIHAEAAVAPHHWALEQRKGEEEASEGPHLCLKGANRQGQRAAPAADALH